MNEFQFEKLIREAAHKEKTNIPEDFNIMLKDTLNKLPEKEARKDGALSVTMWKEKIRKAKAADVKQKRTRKIQGRPRGAA